MQTLTPDQEVVFQRFLSGKSLFITGPAGCGKSFLIQHIKEHCERRSVPLGVTALTGTAACIIGGQTLHGWGGLGLAKDSADAIIKIICMRPVNHKRWRETSVLIIDEISMMSAELFNKICLIAQKIRCKPGFFGGMQVVFCGDFAQLEPIGSDKYCFESTLWREHLTDNTFYLPRIIRQSDPVFQKVLMNLRLGKIDEETKRILNTRLITDESEADIIVNGLGEETKIKATVLFPKKKDVERINKDELHKLINAGAANKNFKAEDTVVHKKSRKSVDINKVHKDALDKGLLCPEILTLAIGAQVMLIKNKSLEDGLVNGSRGVVISFDATGCPVVVFDDGQQLSIAQEPFEIESGANCIIRKQIPLILAWAITVHKCQGATLTNVITDLSEVFGYAQVYVTLSRVRSLEGLFIVSLNYKKILCNPKVRKYYEDLEKRLTVPTVPE